jgi:hypothetical protein
MQTSLISRAATRLSGMVVKPRDFARFYGLAQLSLVFSALSMLSGCLVEDPPDFVKPTRTTPRIDSRLVWPPLDQITIVGKGDPITFRLPVVSEDAGVKVQAYLFLDLSPDPVVTNSVPASTLDDTSRRLELAYRPMTRLAEFGCHRFMARVSHADNFIFDTLPAGAPLNVADVAEVNWLVNVVNIAAGDDGSVLRDCPQTVSVTP